MTDMTQPQQVLTRLSAEVVAISQQLARVSAELTQLAVPAQTTQTVPTQTVPAQTVPAQAVPTHTVPQPPAYPQYPYAGGHPWSYPAPPPVTVPKPAERRQNWIGKALAAVGVGVTLIGVVLLVVLAAQAGLLAPPVRIAAGAVLAVGLIVAAHWLFSRPGGRVGAIALAATGIAAAYIDLVAVTTVYHWIPAPAGLVLSTVIAGGGLLLTRRWNSEQLGLLVLVPLIVLAPVVVGEFSLLLVGYMLALSAVTLLAQLGKDWVWMYAARTAAGSIPVLVALIGVAFGSGHQGWLAVAAGIAAVLAIGSALMLLPQSAHRTGIAVVAAVGALPLLGVSAAVDRVIAAPMLAVLSVGTLVVVRLGVRWPGVTAPVRQVWSALSVVAALIAVAVAFDGAVAGPVLLALAVLVAVAGRRSTAAQCAALVFGAVGSIYLLVIAGPETLITATVLTVPDAASVLVSSVLLTLFALTHAWVANRRCDPDTARLLLAGAAVVIGYAVTVGTVTAGVLLGGPTGGFLAGHMAATICWIVLAAGLFGYAARRPRNDRSLPIGAGMTLVAAAVAKLFLFDLGTLDGIFRVAVFIVVGLVLLGMGAGYARLLAQQSD